MKKILEHYPTWDLLPLAIRKYIVENCDLNYNYYIHSYSETVKSILHNPRKDDANYKIAQEYYVNMPIDNFIELANSNMSDLETEVVHLRKVINVLECA